MLEELSAFILAFNEEDNIERCINNCVSALKKYARKYELIVVYYDGSTDTTLKKVEDLKKRHPCVRIVHQKKEEKGYGTALRLGIESSGYHYIFYTDGDNQFNIKELDRLIPFLTSFDIVSGYRMNRKDPFMRIFTAKVYNIIINMLFWSSHRDVDSAFKIYKKKIFDTFRIESASGAADAEILLRAKHNKFKVLEVPVSHFSRYAGKPVFEAGNSYGLIKPVVVLHLLKDLFRLRWRIMFRQKTRQ